MKSSAFDPGRAIECTSDVFVMRRQGLPALAIESWESTTALQPTQGRPKSEIVENTTIGNFPGVARASFVKASDRQAPIPHAGCNQ